jgi:hypothetical protein
MRSHLRIKFGITLEDWIALYKSQDGRCPICEIALPDLADVYRGSHAHGPKESKSVWNTDHCHATGKVRGILCRNCNMGLGAFLDNPDVLFAAADYIEFHRKP